MDDVLVLFIPTMTPSCFMQGRQIHNKFALAGVFQAHYCFAATFTFAQLQQLGNDSPASASWSFTFWGCHNPKKPRKVAKTPKSTKVRKLGPLFWKGWDRIFTIFTRITRAVT